MRFRITKPGDINEGKCINATSERLMLERYGAGNFEDVSEQYKALPSLVTVFTSMELIEAFTTDELFAIEGSNHPQVKKLWRVLSLKRKRPLSVTDTVYQQSITLLESEGLLTTERANEFRVALPED